MKTQTKTTVILLLAFFIVITSFSIFVYISFTNYTFSDFNKLLEIRVLTVAKAELDDKPSSGLIDIRDQFFEKLSHERDFIFQLDTIQSFNLVAQRMNVPLAFFESILQNGKANYNNRRLYFKGIKYSVPKGNYIVIASAENYFESHHTAYLKKNLFFAIGIALAFALVISLYLSTYVFKPLRKITERVKQISLESLNLRLDEENNNDELAELKQTFNDMLNRIETSFETQNNFISNASHELRTPLTAIIGEADVCLSKLRKPEEYIETIKIILDEAEKLDSKTKALLFLAQTGFNGKVQKFDKLRIDQLVWDVKDTVERINPKNKIHLDMSLLPENPAKLIIYGNEQLLHLALSNVVSNACKYSNSQLVNISIGASTQTVFIVVRDSGIGIPDQELKHIYDPFFRASNTKNYEGYGIGLPLARNIVRMHNGEILVSSIEEQGTTVQFNLPIGYQEA